MLTVLLATGLAAAVAGSERPRPQIYTLIIGNNASPAAEPDLSTLQYADDDAARFYELWSRTNAHQHLLSVLDEKTQRRHRGLVPRALPPTRQNLLKAADDLQTRVQQDRDNGLDAILYIYFSGHGSTASDGEPYLALLDDGLTREQLFEVVDRIAAPRVHLVIDACNAGAVVGVRGPFDDALEARPAPPPPAVRSALASNLVRRPHVGVIAAASSGQAAHEWSRIESGVFSHEVLSALSGGGDVNEDGRIEYSELEAFIGAANARVLDPRGRPTIEAVAPAIDQHATIVDLAWLRPGPFLIGRISNAAQGRFSLERDDGLRLLDVHLSAGASFVVALPPRQAVYVRTRDTEAYVPPQETGTIPLAQLEFRPRDVGRRGALDTQLRRGLFAVPYGPEYYRGFVDSRGIDAVDFAQAKLILPRPSEGLTSLQAIATSSWIVGATALVAAGVAGGVAIERKAAFDSAETQREAASISDAYDVSRSVMIGSLVAAAVFAGIGAVIWLSDDPAAVSVGVTPELGGTRATVSWQARF